jgi:NADH-quinone oxidoreductase subunit N
MSTFRLWVKKQQLEENNFFKYSHLNWFSFLKPFDTPFILIIYYISNFFFDFLALLLVLFLIEDFLFISFGGGGKLTLEFEIFFMNFVAALAWIRKPSSSASNPIDQTLKYLLRLAGQTFFIYVGWFYNHPYRTINPFFNFVSKVLQACLNLLLILYYSRHGRLQLSFGVLCVLVVLVIDFHIVSFWLETLYIYVGLSGISITSLGSILASLDFFRFDMFWGVTSLFSTLYVIGTFRNSLVYFKRKDYLDFLSLLSLGFLLIILLGAVAHSFLLVILIESLALLSIAYAGLNVFSRYSMEGSVKYLIFGALASIFLLAGILILSKTSSGFYLSGFSLTVLPLHLDFFSYDNAFESQVGSTLIIISFMMKLGAFPFHFYLGEVYHGSMFHVMSFFAVNSKFILFCVFLRVLFSQANIQTTAFISPLLSIVAGASLIFGSLLAFLEKKIKRFLFYTSVNQLGFALASLASVTSASLASSYFFMIVYLANTLLLFTSLMRIQTKGNWSDFEYITELYKPQLTIRPGLQSNFLLFLIAIINFGGVPPSLGFFTKYFIFETILSNGHVFLFFVGVVSSLFSFCYYLGLVLSFFYAYERNMKESRLGDVVRDKTVGGFFSLDYLKTKRQKDICLFDIYQNQLPNHLSFFEECASFVTKVGSETETKKIHMLPKLVCSSISKDHPSWSKQHSARSSLAELLNFNTYFDKDISLDKLHAKKINRKAETKERKVLPLDFLLALLVVYPVNLADFIDFIKLLFTHFS